MESSFNSSYDATFWQRATTPNATILNVAILKKLAGELLSEVEVLDERIIFKEEFSLPLEVERFEAALIRYALVITGGHQKKAARMLGLRPTTLHTKLRRYGII